MAKQPWQREREKVSLREIIRWAAACVAIHGFVNRHVLSTQTRLCCRLRAQLPIHQPNCHPWKLRNRQVLDQSFPIKMLPSSPWQLPIKLLQLFTAHSRRLTTNWLLSLSVPFQHRAVTSKSRSKCLTWTAMATSTPPSLRRSRTWFASRHRSAPVTAITQTLATPSR